MSSWDESVTIAKREAKTRPNQAKRDLQRKAELQANTGAAVGLGGAYGTLRGYKELKAGGRAARASQTARRAGVAEEAKIRPFSTRAYQEGSQQARRASGSSRPPGNSVARWKPSYASSADNPNAEFKTGARQAASYFQHAQNTGKAARRLRTRGGLMAGGGLAALAGGSALLHRGNKNNKQAMRMPSRIAKAGLVSFNYVPGQQKTIIYRSRKPKMAQAEGLLRPPLSHQAAVQKAFWTKRSDEHKAQLKTLKDKRKTARRRMTSSRDLAYGRGVQAWEKKHPQLSYVADLGGFFEPTSSFAGAVGSVRSNAGFKESQSHLNSPYGRKLKRSHELARQRHRQGKKDLRIRKAAPRGIRIQVEKGLKSDEPKYRHQRGKLYLEHDTRSGSTNQVPPDEMHFKGKGKSAVRRRPKYNVSHGRSSKAQEKSFKEGKLTLSNGNTPYSRVKRGSEEHNALKYHHTRKRANGITTVHKAWGDRKAHHSIQQSEELARKARKRQRSSVQTAGLAATGIGVASAFGNVPEQSHRIIHSAREGKNLAGGFRQVAGAARANKAGAVALGSAALGAAALGSWGANRAIEAGHYRRSDRRRRDNYNKARRVSKAFPFKKTRQAARATNAAAQQAAHSFSGASEKIGPAAEKVGNLSDKVSGLLPSSKGKALAAGLGLATAAGTPSGIGAYAGNRANRPKQPKKVKVGKALPSGLKAAYALKDAQNARPSTLPGGLKAHLSGSKPSPANRVRPPARPKFAAKPPPMAPSQRAITAGGARGAVPATIPKPAMAGAAPRRKMNPIVRNAAIGTGGALAVGGGGFALGNRNKVRKDSPASPDVGTLKPLRAVRRKQRATS